MACTAIRDQESRLRFVGYRVENLKLAVFTFSAALAGIAGALYVPQVGIINPTEFSPLNSIEIVIWVAVTGSLAALGAAVALPHPLTILSAFLAAPFTTLHPALAAGWVSGLVEAWLRPPAVADFEALPEAMENLKTFLRNPVVRILLVVATTNIGGSLGTFVAIPWIASR